MNQRFANITPLSIASLFPITYEMEQFISDMNPATSLMTPLSSQFQYSPSDFYNQSHDMDSPSSQYTSCEYYENTLSYSPISQLSPIEQSANSFNEIPDDTTSSQPEPQLISVHPSSRTLQAKRSSSAHNFACPVCSLTFSRKNSMRRHVLSHINLRPYTCLPCNRSFYRADIYKRHLNSSRCQRLSSQSLLAYQ